MAVSKISFGVVKARKIAKLGPKLNGLLTGGMPNRKALKTTQNPQNTRRISSWAQAYRQC